MKDTHTIFFSLLRAALWNETSERVQVSAEQSPALAQCCARQGVGPLVFPLLLTTDHPLRTEMKRICVQTMQQQVKLQEVLATAWQALTQAGIQPVLMKGVGLAALYPEPQQRQWGDIDLFVGKEQYHPSCAVMRETFPQALKFDEELDHYKHYNLITDGVSIELHRVSLGLQHPRDERRYARIENEGMDKAQEQTINGLTVRVPEPTFNALFVMMHAWEHGQTAGATVRQLCDLALLLHHHASEINRTQLKQNLCALSALDVWQLYMYLLVTYLGLPLAEAPFYTPACSERAERMITDLLNGGMASEQTDDATPAPNRIVRKWRTMQKRLAHAQHIARYSPAYARHEKWTTIIHGALRFFAKDRHWE